MVTEVKKSGYQDTTAARRRRTELKWAKWIKELRANGHTVIEPVADKPGEQ